MADQKTQNKLLWDFHVRAKQVCGADFDAQALCFITSGTRVRGLLRPLKKYMQTHAHTARRRLRPMTEARLRACFPAGRVFARSDAHAMAERAATRTYAGVALLGREHGVCVHSECQTALRAFLARAYASVRKHGPPATSIQAILREAVPAPDPCVPDLLAFFAHCGLVPLASELPVYSATLRTATAVDVLLRDSATGDLIVADIKTGAPPALANFKYSHTTLKLRRDLQVPVRDRAEDSFIEHRLQLALTRRMLCEHIPGTVRAELIYVTPIMRPVPASGTGAALACGHEARITMCPLGDAFITWADRLKTLDD